MRQKPVNLRKIISDRLDELGWTRYRAWAEMQDQFKHRATFYEFIAGRKDISIDKLEIVLSVLGLRVRGRSVSGKTQSASTADPRSE